MLNWSRKLILNTVIAGLLLSMMPVQAQSDEQFADQVVDAISNGLRVVGGTTFLVAGSMVLMITIGLSFVPYKGEDKGWLRLKAVATGISAGVMTLLGWRLLHSKRVRSHNNGSGDEAEQS